MVTAVRHLVLLRHAKAFPGPADHDRALEPRGVVDAAEAGSVLSGHGWVPDAALVSDARRTRQTFEHVADALHEQPRVIFTAALYGAAADDILETIRTAEDATACLLVIGHNPGIGDLARRLARHGTAADLDRLATGFPTACIAVIAVSEPWSGLTGDGTLQALVWPRGIDED